MQNSQLSLANLTSSLTRFPQPNSQPPLWILVFSESEERA